MQSSAVSVEEEKPELAEPQHRREAEEATATQRTELDEQRNTEAEHQRRRDAKVKRLALLERARQKAAEVFATKYLMRRQQQFVEQVGTMLGRTEEERKRHPSMAMRRVDAAAIALRVQPLSKVPAADIEQWKEQMSEVLQSVQQEQAASRTVDTTGWTAAQYREHRNKNRRTVYKVRRTPAKVQRQLDDELVVLEVQSRLQERDTEVVTAIALERAAVKLDTPTHNRRRDRHVHARAETVADEANKRQRAEVPATPPNFTVAAPHKPAAARAQKPAPKTPVLSPKTPTRAIAQLQLGDGRGV